MKRPTFTIFTPTYNRANCIHRVYDSLLAQTIRDFEWIVVDDGSDDDTGELISVWFDEADFPINYIYQEHAGKSAAWNRALSAAMGEFFVIADSDDKFLPSSLETMLSIWETIPIELRERFRGVSCRCYEQSGETVIGSQNFPEPYLDATSPDVVYGMGMNYEMWGMNRVDVLKEYPLPEIEGLKFYSEAIIWDRMSKRYMSRFFNTPLRIVFDDQANKTTTKVGNTRFRENYLLWSHYLNEMGRYFLKVPALFCKSAVGIIRDGILCRKAYREILHDIQPVPFKFLAVAGTPLAACLARKEFDSNSGKL